MILLLLMLWLGRIDVGKSLFDILANMLLLNEQIILRLFRCLDLMLNTLWRLFIPLVILMPMAYLSLDYGIRVFAFIERCIRVFLCCREGHHTLPLEELS